jgi:7,8-dihydro-6-hydroxymethylpterin-pyrophosphokinase
MVVVRMGLHGRRRHRRRRRRQMDICLLLVNDESVFNTGSESMAIPELLEAAN